LASLEVPDTEEAWDGRDFALHSVRWTPDSDDAGSAPEFSGTLPPGCLLLGVTLGPMEEGEDWEADFMEASPVIALRWNPDGANAPRVHCCAAVSLTWIASASLPQARRACACWRRRAWR
jgi:hypothetical protein